MASYAETVRCLILCFDAAGTRRVPRQYRVTVRNGSIAGASLLEHVKEATQDDGVLVALTRSDRMFEHRGLPLGLYNDEATVLLCSSEASDELMRINRDIVLMRIPETVFKDVAAANGVFFFPELLNGEARQDTALPVAKLAGMMMADLANGMSADAPLVRAYAIAFAGFAIASHHSPGYDQKPHSGGIPVYILRRLNSYINANLSRVITLDQLASVAGMSRFHFARAFRQSTGETPLRFVTRLRVEAAISEMKATDLSLTEISLATGFGSSQSFSRSFKRLVGVSPNEFRAAARRQTSNIESTGSGHATGTPEEHSSLE